MKNQPKDIDLTEKKKVGFGSLERYREEINHKLSILCKDDL